MIKDAGSYVNMIPAFFVAARRSCPISDHIYNDLSMSYKLHHHSMAREIKLPAYSRREPDIKNTGGNNGIFKRIFR